MKRYEENMRKYEENMKNYEGITLLIYRPWDLKKFRGVGVPGPRKRLGFSLSPPDIFSKGHFPKVTTSGSGGFRKIPVWGGENKNMKHVNFVLLAR